jgi:2-oxoglutarate/2-oxoacid ferredoxin oxidoreductase subunit alpha
MSDLDLAMNNWMSDPFPYPTRPLKRGKILSAEDLDRLGGFERYRDVDGDGIGYRTLPGTLHPKAAYFARGSGHNEGAVYSERPEDYVHNMDRLRRKFESARTRVPEPVIQQAGGAEIGFIAFGTTHWAIEESLDQLKQEHDIAASYCRLRAYPFCRQVFDFIKRHRRVYVVEQNRDAQMFGLLRLEVDAEDVGRLRSVRHYNGLPIDARTVTDEVLCQEARQKHGDND